MFDEAQLASWEACEAGLGNGKDGRQGRADIVEYEISVFWGPKWKGINLAS